MSYLATALADSPRELLSFGDSPGTTAADLSGNARDGAYSSGWTLGAAGLLSGDPGTAAASDGAPNTRVVVPAGAWFDFGTGDFTFEGWIKTAETGVNAVLVGSTGGPATWFGVNPAGQLIFSNGASSGHGSAAVNDNAPHHVAVTRTAGSVQFYVDGGLDGAPLSGGDLGAAAGNSTTAVGFANFESNTFPDSGKCQWFAVYGSALSPSRVAAHFAAGGTPALSVAANLSDVTILSASSASVTGGTPSGGSGSYACAWHLSTTPNFTPGPGTLVAGQTGLTATFAGLAAGTDYWAVCVVSDGTSTATSLHRLVRVAGLAPLVVGVVGDSVEAAGGAYDHSTPPAAYLQNFLSSRQLRAVTVVNGAVSGTQTSDWQPGGANMDALLASLAAASAPARSPVRVRLGVNDAQAGVDAGTFAARLAAAVGAITGAGYVAILDYPTWREPGVFFENAGLTFDESTTPLLLAYQAAIDALVDGSTVFAGDRESFYSTAMRPTAYLNRSAGEPGGIHPVDAGAELLAANAARAIALYLDPPGGGPGTAVFPVLGCGFIRGI